MHFSPATRATRPAHHMLLDLLISILYGHQYKPCSFAICSFSQHSVTPALSCPNVFPFTQCPTPTASFLL